jgi:hypothetical protein
VVLTSSSIVATFSVGDKATDCDIETQYKTKVQDEDSVSIDVRGRPIARTRGLIASRSVSAQKRNVRVLKQFETEEAMARWWESDGRAEGEVGS